MKYKDGETLLKTRQYLYSKFGHMIIYEASKVRLDPCYLIDEQEK